MSNWASAQGELMKKIETLKDQASIYMTEAEIWLAEQGYQNSDLFKKIETLKEPRVYADDFMQQARIREQHIAKFGFAILDKKAVELLRGYAPLLEVGAGSGYWSYELKKAGIDVIATDSGTGKYGFFTEGKKEYSKWEPYTDIETLTADEAIAKYPERNLLTVWPDYDLAWSGDMLKKFTGQYVCYVGEGSGGCTGCDEFHEILNTQFTDVADQHIPQFDCIHDRLTIYKRKGE